MKCTSKCENTPPSKKVFLQAASDSYNSSIWSRASSSMALSGKRVSSATPAPQECQHLAFFYLQHCLLAKGKLLWHLLSRSSTRVLLLWETWQWIVWTKEEFSGAVTPLQQEEADILVTIPFWYKLFPPPVLGGLFTDDKKKIIFPCFHVWKKKSFFLFFFHGPSELKINQAGCF